MRKTLLALLCAGLLAFPTEAVKQRMPKLKKENLVSAHLIKLNGLLDYVLFSYDSNWNGKIDTESWHNVLEMRAMGDSVYTKHDTIPETIQYDFNEDGRADYRLNDWDKDGFIDERQNLLEKQQPDSTRSKI